MRVSDIEKLKDVDLNTMQSGLDAICSDSIENFSGIVAQISEETDETHKRFLQAEYASRLINVGNFINGMLQARNTLVEFFNEVREAKKQRSGVNK